MTSKKILVSLVALFALVVLSIVNVSASFGSIERIEVNDINAFLSQDIGVDAGETLNIEVYFRASDTVEDVRVEAEILGDPDLRAVSKELSVVQGKIYRWVLSLKMPESLDEEDLEEDLDLFVSVESKEAGRADSFGIDLTLQRESNDIEILDVDMENEVNAGDVLTLDVVVKNRGRQTSEDTFVVARIPALKIEDKAYFGDLTPMDVGEEPGPEDEDTNERRLSLKIPSNTPVGVYVVEVEASNDEATTTVTKKVAVTGAEKKTQVVAPIHSRSVDAGETAEYTIVLVNSGTQVGVFELVVESSTGLTVDVSEPVVALPAGSSKTVKLEAKSDKADSYNFAVNVHSGGELVAREEFTTVVEGAKAGGNVIGKTSPTVLLTVVLAVIFVVLLIVLIVLLTRKPEKSEEFGESYY